MAYKVKGEVLEKLNRNDEAIEIYNQAKDIVEKIYGNNNQMINEIVIAIIEASKRKKTQRNY